MSLAVRNSGARVWRHASTRPSDVTRIGAHLLDSFGGLVTRDWCRADLPHDEPVGASATVPLEMPPIGTTGRYVIRLDVVLEGVTWYESKGSSPVEVTIDVVEAR